MAYFVSVCAQHRASRRLDFGRNEAQPSVNEEITLKTSNYMPFRKFAKALANAVASWRKMT